MDESVVESGHEMDNSEHVLVGAGFTGLGWSEIGLLFFLNDFLGGLLGL